jgi:hypothetical protein
VQRTDQVGGEDEASLEDRDDQEVAIAGGLDFRRHLDIAPGDRLGIIKNAQRPASYLGHEGPFSID